MSTAFLLCLLVFFGLFTLGSPIAYAMIAGGSVYLITTGQDTGLMAEQIMNGMFDSYLLLAVPLFILAANLMNAGNISDRLLAFCMVAVGRFRGGLAHVNVVANILFAGMSGSAVADAAGLGKLITEMMTKTGRYTPGFSAALTAAASTIAPIIPPSIPLVLFALVSDTSIGYLFIGGVLPGLLMGVSLMTAIAISARVRNFQPDKVVPLRELPRRTLEAFPVLMLPVILIVGLRGGAMTPTEAAAVAALYALFLAAVVYRALPFADFVRHLTDAARATATVGIIISGAFALNYVAASENLPNQVATLIQHANLSPMAFMLCINLLFLALGCLFDTTILLLVLVPMLIPSCRALGIDLVYFGVVIVVNMMIGLITPPFGVLLFVMNGVTGIPLAAIIREIWLFIAVLITVLAILVFVPDVTLYLPRALGYQG